METDLAAGRRPPRCYCVNVKRELARPAFLRGSAPQLHITDNFTLIDDQNIHAAESCQQIAQAAVGTS